MSNVQQVDWITIREGVAVKPVNSYIELPVFDAVATNWAGASDIAKQYGYSASSDFTIPRVPQIPSDIDYCLCIRYRIGNEVFRYKLWADVGEVLTSAPLYTGQLIKANFVLEVWTIADGVSVQNDAIRQFILSIRTVPSDYRDLSLTVAATGTEVSPLVNTNDINLPSGITPAFRFDAGAGLTLGAGTDIVSWDDQVNAIQLAATGAGVNQYVAVNSGIIGKSAVNIVSDGALTNLAPYAVLDRCIFLVFKFTTYASLNNLLSAAFGVFKFQAVANRVGWLYNGVNTSNPAINLVVGQWYNIMLYTTELSAGIRPVRIYVEKLDDDNTVVIDSSINTASGTSGTSSITISGAANTCDFHIAEIVGYNAGISADQISQVLVYLRSKYQAGMTLPLTFSVGSPWLDNEE